MTSFTTVPSGTITRFVRPVLPLLPLPVAAPADALPGRGGLKLSLKPALSDGLPGVRDWFTNYPFACLEQKTSKSVGLRDGKLWQTVATQIPSYLDSDGLANYFPVRPGEASSEARSARRSFPKEIIPDFSRECLEVNPVFLEENPVFFI